MQLVPFRHTRELESWRQNERGRLSATLSNLQAKIMCKNEVSGDLNKASISLPSNLDLYFDSDPHHHAHHLSIAWLATKASARAS